MRRGAASEVLVEGRLWIPATVPLVVGGVAGTDATPASALGVVSTTLLANSRAGIAAYVLLRRGIAEYAVIVARKPSPGDATRGDPRPA